MLQRANRCPTVLLALELGTRRLAAPWCYSVSSAIPRVLPIDHDFFFLSLDADEGQAPKCNAVPTFWVRLVGWVRQPISNLQGSQTLGSPEQWSQGVN